MACSTPSTFETYWRVSAHKCQNARLPDVRHETRAMEPLLNTCAARPRAKRQGGSADGWCAVRRESPRGSARRSRPALCVSSPLPMRSARLGQRRRERPVAFALPGIAHSIAAMRQNRVAADAGLTTCWPWSAASPGRSCLCPREWRDEGAALPVLAPRWSLSRALRSLATVAPVHRPGPS
jgi:hypothetical protein